MEEKLDKKTPKSNLSSLVKPFQSGSNMSKILVAVIVLSLASGVATGYVLSDKSSASQTGTVSTQFEKSAGAPQQDNKTFRDFAEGTVRARPQPSDPTEYLEGTHLLQRDGAYPVALTSSVVDLSKYEGKKVKVFGETQKAVKEGWLMDVGKVEEK